jgi:hypothetical protein
MFYQALFKVSVVNTFSSLPLVFPQKSLYLSVYKSALSKANSMLYAFRYLNLKLSRSQFKTLINAHFLSKLTYASQVWSGT